MALPAGITIAWPSTAASIPSGWTRVTDLDSKYIKGIATDSTDPGTTGGSATHTHTTSGHVHSLNHSHGSKSTPAGGGSTAEPDSSVYAPFNHTHSFSAPTNNSVDSASESPNLEAESNDPAHLVVIWIESDGTPENIPSGALVFWNDSSGLPSGYTLYDDAKNVFLKGAAAAGNGGGTDAGNLTHDHTVASHTHSGGSHSHSNSGTSASGTIVARGEEAGSSGARNHSHTSFFSTTSTGDLGANSATSSEDSAVVPPYTELAIVESNGTTPTQVIVVWRGTLANIPAGWVLCDGTNNTPNLVNTYVTGANILAEIGDTGGSLGTHTHTGGSHNHTVGSHTHNATFGGPSSTGDRSGSSVGVASGNHQSQHATTTSSASPTVGSADAGASSADTTEPEHEQVAFIQFQIVDLELEENLTIIVEGDSTVSYEPAIVLRDFTEDIVITITFADTDVDIDEGVSFVDDWTITIDERTTATATNITRREAAFINKSLQIYPSHGESLSNYFKFRVFPRRVSEEPEVLGFTDSRIKIGALSSSTITINYKDEFGGSITGFEILNPESPDNYDFNSQQDGNGSDLTSQLVITSLEKGASSTKITFQNNGQEGFLYLEIEGKGVFRYQPVDFILEDEESINIHGIESTNISQTYKSDFGSTVSESYRVLERDKNPRVEFLKVDLLANDNRFMMDLFTLLEVGDKIYIKNTKYDLDNNFYIQGKNFTIKQGGIIYFSLLLKEDISIWRGLTPIKLVLDSSASAIPGIKFYPIRQLSYRDSSKSRTFTGWVNLYDSASTERRTVLSIGSSSIGTEITVLDDSKLLEYRTGYSIQDGVWLSDTPISSGNVHFTVTHDDQIGNAPKIYIDGVESSITQSLVPSGVKQDESDYNITIGYRETTSGNFNPLHGDLQNLRIYDDIKDEILVARIYDNPIVNDLVTDGRVFEVPNVKDEEFVEDGNLSTLGVKVIDNVFGYVGEAVQAPVMKGGDFLDK